MMEQWVNEVWGKIEKKVSATSRSTPSDLLAYTTEDGKFVNERSVFWWTNGFWPGIMWLMYMETKDEHYKNVAEKLEEKLDEGLYGFDGLHHDVGFMWLLSSVANYRITGNEQSQRRGLIAASYLMARYNDAGKFLRAWNQDMLGYSIIDSMMNIPLLYWASEEKEDPRFKFIAMNHADTTLREFIRPDGSVNHIVCFDPETGEVVETLAGQGYEVGSSWTRGQAWALYGFTLSYIHTKKQEYLDGAKRVAHYFISALAALDDYVPNCDFRSPKEPVYKDTTAGAIAACGLLEIAKIVPEFEKGLYYNAAVRILKETEARYCNWSEEEASIVQMGTEAYKRKTNIPIIYGDYYFIEAILKLKGMDLLLW